MKAVALIFLVVAVAAVQSKVELSFGQKVLTAALRTKCRWSENVDLKQEKEIHEGKFDNLSENQKCFIKCMNDAVHFLDEESNVNEEVLHQLLDPLVGAEEANKVSAACDHLKGENPCDQAAKIYACHFSHGAAFLI